LRGRFALLYAVSFTMTMTLEFYGTSLGAWTWAARSPLAGLPAANPPACIGAGYCIMDAITRWMAPRIQRLLGRAFVVAQTRVHRQRAKEEWSLPAQMTTPASSRGGPSLTDPATTPIAAPSGVNVRKANQ
jgi:hypothetical protein